MCWPSSVQKWCEGRVIRPKHHLLRKKPGKSSLELTESEWEFNIVCHQSMHQQDLVGDFTYVWHFAYLAGFMLAGAYLVVHPS